jgi:hypothetical protein
MEPGRTMGVHGLGSFFCLWAVRARSAKVSALTEPWATPPITSTMKIERGGACLHLSSQLCLTSRPSRSVSCRISQRLSLSLSSRLRPEPQPPLFITPQPFVGKCPFCSGLFCCLWRRTDPLCSAAEQTPFSCYCCMIDFY